MSTTAYKYKVKDTTGRLVTGSLEAESIPLVATKLRQMGFVPINIEKSRTGFSSEISIPGLTDKVKMKEVAVFSRQFATMINAGVTLTRSLAILASQAENKALAKVIDQVRVDVENGSALSVALAKHPKVYNDLYVSMVRAGEVGGSLDRTLMDLAAMIEKQVELRGKIRSAMSYPVAVLSLVCLILAAMLLFVVPIFKKMYAELNGKLPLLTRVLIAVSGYAVEAVPVVIVGGVLGVMGYRRWTATDRGRFIMDSLKLRVPIFGLLVQKTAMSRFASTLSTLLSSGVPVLEALEITADTVSNKVVARGIEAISEGVKEGDPLTSRLGAHPVFPGMVSQMMAVGEETGALDQLLAKVATFYDQEVSATVDALTSLLEPLLIMILGGAVGGMVIALYLPMFDVIKLVNGNNS
jgi:type IV pilus assembly protein PilC